MWQILKPDDLLDYFSDRERQSLQAAKKDFDSASAQRILTQVSNFVRGRVGANRVNRLAPPPAIPNDLVAVALDLAVVRYATTVAGVLLDPDKKRGEASQAALKTLDDVAAGKSAIDQPDPADPNQPEARPHPLPMVDVPFDPLATPDYDPIGPGGTDVYLV